MKITPLLFALRGTAQVQGRLQARSEISAAMISPDEQHRSAKVLAPGCLLAAMLLSTQAAATVYTVGPGADCTHASLLDAIAVAAADASVGPHQIRIARPSITLAAQDYSISNPAADIVIRGGYASCSAEQPSSGARTELVRTGSGRRVLDVSNAVTNPRRTVTLSRLTLRGGQPSTGSGGGIQVIGRASVELTNETAVIENQATNGGGVGLVNLSVDPDLATVLLVTGGARICDNRASGAGSNGNGGGVHMVGSSTLRLWNGQICDNEARRHGGGVFLLGTASRMLLDPWQGELVDISGNVAGDDTFALDTGFGGGVYVGANASISYETSNTPPTALSLNMSTNRANFGGALYATGGAESDSSFTSIELRNAALMGNAALGKGGALMLSNAVDLRLVKFGAGSCQFFGPQPCVWGIGNVASNTSFPSDFGAGGFAFMDHVTDAPRPALRVAGALFSGNEDPNGTAAVIDARGNSSVRILRSVFTGNIAGGGQVFRALIESRSNMLFAYNTVLGNSVTRLLWLDAGNEVNATGSILYSPGVAPFAGLGSLVHNGCLISHTAAGLPPGVTVQAPRLGAGFAPRGGSPAIDACAQGVGDVFWSAALDAYAQPAPFDVESIPNINGPWDIGAVEQRDIIHYSGFGQRPGN